MEKEIRNYYHIGMVGPVNPSAFGMHIPDVDLPVMYTNTTAVSTYIAELLSAGHTVSIFTDSYESDQVAEYHSDKLHIYIVPRDFRRNGLRTFSPLTFHLKLSRFIRQHLKGIDVIHAQWTYEYALAAKQFVHDLPVFCTVRDWCPYILSLQEGWKVKLRWYFYLFVFRKVMSSDRIHFIANSDYTYNRIVAEYPRKEVSVIFNPIDKRVVLEAPKGKVDHPVFISISHIVSDKRKNNQTLIEAFRLVKNQKPEAELWLVGENVEDTSLFDYARDHNLMDGVKFLGRLPHDQIIELIDSATCLVHPSFEETFGNILVEGMSRCIPCIGGEKSGAVPQVLDYGKCGILCDISSPVELSKSMLLSQDKEYIYPIVKRATERINLLFRSDVTMQHTLDLYAQYL